MPAPVPFRLICRPTPEADLEQARARAQEIGLNIPRTDHVAVDWLLAVRDAAGWNPDFLRFLLLEHPDEAVKVTILKHIIYHDTRRRPFSDEEWTELRGEILTREIASGEVWTPVMNAMSVCMAWHIMLHPSIEKAFKRVVAWARTATADELEAAFQVGDPAEVDSSPFSALIPPKMLRDRLSVSMTAISAGVIRTFGRFTDAYDLGLLVHRFRGEDLAPHQEEVLALIEDPSTTPGQRKKFVRALQAIAGQTHVVPMQERTRVRALHEAGLMDDEALADILLADPAADPDSIAYVWAQWSPQFGQKISIAEIIARNTATPIGILREMADKPREALMVALAKNRAALADVDVAAKVLPRLRLAAHLKEAALNAPERELPGLCRRLLTQRPGVLLYVLEQRPEIQLDLSVVEVSRLLQARDPELRRWALTLLPRLIAEKHPAARAKETAHDGRPKHHRRT